MNHDNIRWLADPKRSPQEQLKLWNKTADFAFDPSYGYSAEDLFNVSPIPELPEGGKEFWENRYQQALTVVPEITEEAEPQSLSSGVLRQIKFNTVGGRRLGAWLGVPADGKVKRLIVYGHGYGGIMEQPTTWPSDTAYLFPCLRGQGLLSTFDDLPSVSAFHVLVGINSKETYIHGENAADVWCAVSALRSLYPDPEIPMYYHGGSFGGGIGAMALPWDKRIRKGLLRVPSFGNHPLRLTLPCTGSGEAVRKKWLNQPEILENTLRWHDSAATIRHATQPVLFICALQDPSVPSPGQFSVWKAHGGPSRLLITPAGHMHYPEEQEILSEIEKEMDQFFR